MAAKRKNASHSPHATSARLMVCPRWLLVTIVLVSGVVKGTAATCRFLWPYRVELLIASLLLTGYRYVYAVTDHGWWALALLVLVVALVVGPLVAWGRTRFWALGIFMRAHSRRLIRAGLMELRTADSSGRLPRIGWVRSTPVGESMTLTCRPGQSAELLDARVEELRAAARCRDVRVTRDPNASHKVTVDVVRRDPLGSVAEVAWLDADADALSMWDPVHLGTDEFGRDVRLSLTDRSLFIGGEPGSGKSSLETVIASHAAKSPDCHLVLIDPNEVQFAPWEDRALAFAGADPDDAIAALELVRDEIGRRRTLLRSLPGVQRKVTREIAAAHHLPVWLLQVDELAFFTSVVGTTAQRNAFNTLARDVVARCRAFAIIPVFATQRPTSDVVPTSLRDLFSLRCALRTTTAASSDVILGEGWSRRGYSATEIDIANRGVGWLRSEGETPVRIKGTWISDATISDLSVTTIRHRPDAAATPHIPAQRMPADDTTDAPADES